jgi:C-terminal, D2-small domain, of ClpB protein
MSVNFAEPAYVLDLEAEVEDIVELMFGDLRARLAERQMTVEISAPALQFIAEQGFDPVYGARPLRRFIARGGRNQDRPGPAIRRCPRWCGHPSRPARLGTDSELRQPHVSYHNRQ